MILGARCSGTAVRFDKIKQTCRMLVRVNPRGSLFSLLSSMIIVWGRLQTFASRGFISTQRAATYKLLPF